MGRWVGGLVSALFAAVGALISTREGASGRYEGAAPAALDQLFNPTLGAVRPLPTASPGLGRESAEAVGAGFLSGQTTADRGENPPHHDQHDNDDEDPLHPQTSPRERGPSIRQRKKFLILDCRSDASSRKSRSREIGDFRFRLTVLACLDAVDRHSKFIIQNSKFIEVSRRKPLFRWR
jgi:hypothetical protein